MRSDDLVPLFDPGPQGNLKLRQGQVDSWNTTTGANTIVVAGAVLTNLKVIGPLTGITAGNYVMILCAGTTWYVLGKLTRP